MKLLQCIQIHTHLIYSKLQHIHIVPWGQLFFLHFWSDFVSLFPLTLQIRGREIHVICVSLCVYGAVKFTSVWIAQGVTICCLNI